MLVKNDKKRLDSDRLVSNLKLIDKITENETLTYYVIIQKNSNII
jgi:hypothetical protein